MTAIPDLLFRRLQQFDQQHVLRWWDQLDGTQQQSLLDQLQSIDLAQLEDLYEQRDEQTSFPARDRIESIEHPASDRNRDLGAAESAYRAGRVAALIVAGGQGSRLGFDQPKGMYPIGPVSGKSLFQLHVEKVRAVQSRYGATMPLLIMTSPATHQDTLTFFAENGNFSLPQEQVWFFCQDTMPAVDLASGRLLMAEPGRLFTSPNGHGGTLQALADNGLFDRLDEHGVEHIFYFQVDNPLTQVGDLRFLADHLDCRADASSKVIAKQIPSEKLGVFALVDGRLTIIEYSDLPGDMAEERDDQGRLRFWAGNPAIHLFDVSFLRCVTEGQRTLPWHIARKKVPYLNERGETVEPESNNALKFEKFIFDVLPLAERWCLQPTSRRQEFMPVKNAAGPESPATARQAISNLAADWLEQAEVQVPRGDNGDAAVPLEVSPLFALDAAELSRKMVSVSRIEGPTYFA